MDDILWVGLILVSCWASLPVVIIFAVSRFDNDVVREGDSHHH